MESNTLKNLSILLTASILISTSGVLGRYIAMPVEVIIWFRAFFAMILLYGFCKVRKQPMTIKSQKHKVPFLLGGIFMAVHWITYFYALKLSNVALGVLSLYTFPIFTAILEPFFLKIKFNPRYIVLGIIVLIGLYVLTPDLDFQNSYVQGILIGLFSALCYAIRILIFKQYVDAYNGTVLMLYQTVVISVILLPTLFFMDLSAFRSQWPYIIILAVVTTATGHSLMLHALQFFSATTASIISSLQPVFGIFLAFIFLGETPIQNTYIGGAIILVAVVIESFKSKEA